MLLVAVLRLLVRAGHVEHAGVVDEAVHGLASGDDRLGERAHGTERVEVELHHLAVDRGSRGRAPRGVPRPTPNERLAALDRAAREDDLRAELRERLRGRRADAARRTGDDERLPGDVGTAHLRRERRQTTRVPPLKHHVVDDVEPRPETHRSGRGRVGTADASRGGRAGSVLSALYPSPKRCRDRSAASSASSGDSRRFTVERFF